MNEHSVQTAAPPPLNQKAAHTPLWPQELNIIGGTGAFESGKTLFGLTIAPGSATYWWDDEGSAKPYKSLGFVHRPLPELVMQKFPSGYKPIDVFTWWVADMRAIPIGKYKVIGLDTTATIESGLLDWVRANPSFFHHTAAQHQAKNGAMLWGDAAILLQQLVNEIGAKCETFYFTVHLKEIYGSDNKPTGRQKPKGNSIFYKLVSLFVEFERKADAKGHKPAMPAGRVIKSRLVHIKTDPQTGAVEIDPKTGEPLMFPILPPRLPQASPAMIRQYMLAPPDYAKLKKEELQPDQVLSEDEKLELRTRAAEAEVETERLRTARQSGGGDAPGKEERAAAAKAKRDAEAAAKTGGHAVQAEVATPTPTNGTAATSPPAPANPAAALKLGALTMRQIERLSSLRSELFGLAGIAGQKEEEKKRWNAILAKRNVTTAKDLSPADADGLIKVLAAKCEELHAARRGPNDPGPDNPL